MSAGSTIFGCSAPHVTMTARRVLRTIVTRRRSPNSAEVRSSDSVIDESTRACDDRRRVRRAIPISSSDRLTATPSNQTGTARARMTSRTTEDETEAGTFAAEAGAPDTVTGLKETSTAGPLPDAAADAGMLHDGVSNPTTGPAAVQKSVSARIQWRTAADRRCSANAATMPS